MAYVISRYHMIPIEESARGVEIRSKEVRIVPLSSVRLNPRNRNKHTKEQIDRLCKIIKYQGFREPITISNQSGLCAAGEGRVLAMQKLGAESIAAIYEDFDSPDMEYAHLVADNEIARWATLDTAGVNFDLAELDGVAFDLDMLGIKDFVLDPSGFSPGTEEEQGQLDEKKPVECPSCGHKFTT